MKRRIGTIQLKANTTFHYAGYECAAWWKKVECNPQTVTLFYDDRSTGFVEFTFYGTRTADYFAALYGGVAVSNKPYVSREVGREDSHHFSQYAYSLFGLLHDNRFHIVLDDDVQVTAEVKVLGERDKGWAHTAVFARVAFVNEVAA
jgi:hypothetical protein